VRAGIAYVPPDRLREGLFLDQSIARNITTTTLRQSRRRFGRLSTSALSAEASRWTERMDIRAASVDAPVRVLSGGNQQRVVLAKWLATDPKVLVLNGPTVGVDIGAKAAIHAFVRRLADRGLAVVMISDDLEELVEHADRVLVLAGGTIAADLAGAQLSEDALAAHLTTTH
jgi:simple sugar transport system ATP-binding protein